MLHSFFFQDAEVKGRSPQASASAGRNRRQQVHGQAMVEMAIVLGVLLLVILGGLDCLQLLMTNYTVSQAVRASAHQAALLGGPDGSNGSWGNTTKPTGTVAETARVILDSGMATDSRKATITVSCARTPCRRYDPITVRITYREAVWAPFPGVFAEATADLSATRLAEKDAQ
jgi:Flp pilus assembly protein TadG